jgi:chromosome segregation ATPase
LLTDENVSLKNQISSVNNQLTISKLENESSHQKIIYLEDHTNDRNMMIENLRDQENNWVRKLNKISAQAILTEAKYSDFRAKISHFHSEMTLSKSGGEYMHKIYSSLQADMYHIWQRVVSAEILLTKKDKEKTKMIERAEKQNAEIHKSQKSICSLERTVKWLSDEVIITASSRDELLNVKLRNKRLEHDFKNLLSENTNLVKGLFSITEIVLALQLDIGARNALILSLELQRNNIIDKFEFFSYRLTHLNAVYRYLTIQKETYTQYPNAT